MSAARVGRVENSLSAWVSGNLRVVATWRGEPVPTAAQPLARGAASADDVRAFTARYLTEDAMVVVAVRPSRTKASPP